MLLNDVEINLVMDFHKSCFNLEDYVAQNKPNIERYMHRRGMKGVKRIEYILSMYYFMFWRFQSIVHPPDALEVSDAFVLVNTYSAHY